MTTPWRLAPWVPCGKHLFLSHASEDAERIAKPLYEALQTRRIVPWADFKDGRQLLGEAPLAELRQSLLRCRHVVYLLTPEALRQTRGWMAAERDMADHLQQLLQLSKQNLFDVELALLFPGADGTFSDSTLIERSVWDRLRPRKVVADTPAGQVIAATNIIVDFVERQIARSRELFTSDLLERIELERADFGLHADQAFLDRLTGADLERFANGAARA